MSRPVRSCRTRQKDTQPPTDEDDAVTTQPVEITPGKKRARRARGHDDDEDDPPAAASRSKVRKNLRKGKLSWLQDMPLDLLLEVFSFLHPYDLLRLSRTTITLRGLLIGRSARSTWIQALAAVPDLPPRPEDLSEYAWTRLLFDGVCHFCDARGVRNVFWRLRMRVCTKCMAEPDTSLIRVDMYERDEDLWDGSLGHYRIPWEDVHERRHAYTYFLRRDYEKIVRASSESKAGNADQQRFINKRTDETKALHEHAKVCGQWYGHQRDQREHDLDDARESRKNAIVKRLEELGYGKEAQWMIRQQDYDGVGRRFYQLKCVNQPKHLTDRMWANMKTEILAFMDKILPAYEADVEYSAVRRRVNLILSVMKHWSPTYIPRVIDLYTMGAVRELLDRPLQDGEDTVTVKEIATALRDMTAVLAHCEAQRRPQLLEALAKIRDEPTVEPGEADLALATSIFKCHSERGFFLGCRNGGFLTATDALTHICDVNHFPFQLGRRPNQGDWAIRERPLQVHRVCGWVPGAGGDGKIDLNTRARAIVEQLIQLVALDPALATFKDMDDADFRFECVDSMCGRTDVHDPLPTTRPILNWRQAVMHSHSSASFKRLLPAEETKAREMAAAFEPTVASVGRRGMWDCVRCTRSRMDTSTLRDHCQTRHSVETPVYGDDYAASDTFFSPLPPFSLPR